MAGAVVRAEGYTHAESMRVLCQGPRPSGLLRQCRHRLLRSCASQELPGSNAKPESMRKGGVEGCLEGQMLLSLRQNGLDSFFKEIKLGTFNLNRG